MDASKGRGNRSQDEDHILEFLCSNCLRNGIAETRETSERSYMSNSIRSCGERKV